MKKVRMMLPLLAIVFAIASAFATVDVVDFDTSVRYDTTCSTCDEVDDPAVCGDHETNFVRCQCSIPNPEGGTLMVAAKNIGCQDLWKQP